MSTNRLASILERLPSIVERLDWRWLATWGAALGLGLGLAGLLALDSPWWLAVPGALFLGLTWLGWDAEPRLAEALVPRPAPKPAAPKLVRDGPFEMVELPGGEFPMGSPDGDDMAGYDEKPRHQVRVSGFRIARTQVTDRLYAQTMRRTPDEKGGELPATVVSWYEAVEFCNGLSRRHGYRPCYRRRGVWRWRRWACDWTADGYRLPTEAEWEYACRAGTQTSYGFGEDPALLADFAWYSENSGGRPHPVGTKRANRWGLFDMHGNLWEWCWDWYGPYRAVAQTDPRGPAGGRGRVLRGGSFDDSPGGLRSARRVVDVPGGWVRGGVVGFRCVRRASPSLDSLYSFPGSALGMQRAPSSVHVGDPRCWSIVTGRHRMGKQALTPLKPCVLLG